MSRLLAERTLTSKRCTLNKIQFCNKIIIVNLLCFLKFICTLWLDQKKSTRSQEGFSAKFDGEAMIQLKVGKVDKKDRQWSAVLVKNEQIGYFLMAS